MEPLDKFTKGQQETTPIQIAGDCFGPSISFDITQHTDPSTEIEIQAFISNDNGVTWDFGGSCKRKGGVVNNPTTGLPETSAFFKSWIVNPIYDKNNKFVKYQPKWKNPLVKTIVKITGNDVFTKIVPSTVDTLVAQSAVPDLHHSIAVVQSVSAAGSSVLSITTANINTTSANLIVGDNYYYAPGGFSSFSDNKSNSYTNNIAEYGTTVMGREYYNANIIGGSGHNFTSALNVSLGYPSVAVTEISGHDPSPFDKSGTVDDVSGTTHTTSSTGTLSQAAELAIGMGGAGAVSTLSVSAPWTQLQNISQDGSREGIITAYQIVSSTTALTFTWQSSASILSAGSISTWKQAAGGAVVAPVPPTLLMMGVG